MTATKFDKKVGMVMMAAAEALDADALVVVAVKDGDAYPVVINGDMPLSEAIQCAIGALSIAAEAAANSGKKE